MKNKLPTIVFILFGILMAAGTLLKLLGVINISSDWFWFIAGLGIIIEGIINLFKQDKFDKKFKVVSHKEWEKIKRDCD